MWIIMAQVSGGVTGCRQSELKRDGKVQEFASFEEAQQLAERLTKQANGPHATANFRYWPEER